MPELQNTKIVKNIDGKQYYESAIYPTIDRDINDIYLITTAGDRFDLLSYKYYKDSSYWWVIAHANNIFNGSLMIPPGIQLRIPTNHNSYIAKIEQSQTVI